MEAAAKRAADAEHAAAVARKRLKAAQDEARDGNGGDGSALASALAESTWANAEKRSAHLRRVKCA